MAHADVEKVLSIQKEYFVKGFNNDPASMVAGVQHPDQFENLFPQSKWMWDPSVASNQAFIREIGDYKEYWVHVDNDNYRKPYLAFLNTNYGLPREVVPTVLHADHLLHKAFAKKYGINYVQLALVWEKYNRGFGFGIEKNFSARKDINGKSMYLVDYSLMFKLLGIEPFQTKSEYEERKEEIANKFVAEGAIESYNIAVEGLDGFFKLWDVLSKGKK
ncbi:hypothetical protein [Alkalihalobacterium elongatum]|uniref:hypothetical protein n=1 Tax=Alkalihalobacterium elongatum TaxID=2675466 RepID=UPI001C1F7089|nr:hypothetical protein [Alkalihalobacterium elongatum]